MSNWGQLRCGHGSPQWCQAAIPWPCPAAVSRGPLMTLFCVLMLMNHTGDSVVFAVGRSDFLRGSYLGYPETQSGTWGRQTFTPFSDLSAVLPQICALQDRCPGSVFSASPVKKSNARCVYSCMWCILSHGDPHEHPMKPELCSRNLLPPHQMPQKCLWPSQRRLRQAGREGRDGTHA